MSSILVERAINRRKHADCTAGFCVAAMKHSAGRAVTFCCCHGARPYEHAMNAKREDSKIGTFFPETRLQQAWGRNRSVVLKNLGSNVFELGPGSCVCWFRMDLSFFVAAEKAVSLIFFG